MHYCGRCGRVKEICLHCLQETGDKETSVYLSICLPVDLSTRLPVYPCTCRPIYGSLLLKRLISRQGESLLCKIWQGKGDMSALSTGNRGFKEASVYLSTCLPVVLSTWPRFLTFKAFKFKTRGVGACITVQDLAGLRRYQETGYLWRHLSTCLLLYL